MPITVIPFNIIDRTELPSVRLDQVPVNGDTMEINSQIYYVCDTDDVKYDHYQTVRVIPGIIGNTFKGAVSGSYFESLSAAITRLQ